MPDVLYFRAHTVVPEVRSVERSSAREGQLRPKRPPKWADYALVFDCESTVDHLQNLTFGCYSYLALNKSKRVYEPIERGIFFADDTPRKSRALIEEYASEHDMRVFSRSHFVEKVFWRTILEAGAICIGFNLVFDLVRIAVRCIDSRGTGYTWSLVLSDYANQDTGKRQPSIYRPPIRIKPRNSTSAFIKLGTMYKDGKNVPAFGRFLDLQTLFSALYSHGTSLKNAYATLAKEGLVKGDAGKLHHTPTGKITLAELEYCARDVEVACDVLNGLKVKYDQHPIFTRPDKVYSSAGIAKGYSRAMKIEQPSKKFSSLTNEIHGIAMQGYYGARAECRIRRTVVPVVCLDFTSQYPSVDALMDLWSVLIAEKCDAVDATTEVREMLEHFTFDDLFDQKFWPKLRFFALVQPDRDIFPSRARYDKQSINIGVNYLTSKQPIWFSGPDILASMILNKAKSRPPRILKAIRLQPSGVQEGLRPTRLNSKVLIDPTRHDFYRHVVEQKQSLKKSSPAVSYFMKILANSGSYGTHIQIDPMTVPEYLVKLEQRKSSAPHVSHAGYVNISVFTGEREYTASTDTIEEAGPWYFPEIAALITGAGRLLLAMAERLITDAGGSFLYCDTDGIGVVATKEGRLIPCEGGREETQPELEEGWISPNVPAIRALSHERVQSITQRFESLNPYDDSKVPGSILAIKGGLDREVFGYAVSSKRYALFTREGNDIQIVDCKQHGLGGYLDPSGTGDFDEEMGCPQWIKEFWLYILRKELGLPNPEPVWLDKPVMRQVKITTPEVLRSLLIQQEAANLPWSKRVKPYNFLLSPILDPQWVWEYKAWTNGETDGKKPGGKQILLICPYSKDADPYDLKFFNHHHPADPLFRLALDHGNAPNIFEPDMTSDERAACEAYFKNARAKTFRNIAAEYLLHPEAKSLGPDGRPCDEHTKGLLQRWHIHASRFQGCGKESHRRIDEDLEDFESLVGILDPIEYLPKKEQDDIPQLLAGRNRAEMARHTGLSERVLHKASKGGHVTIATRKKIMAAAEVVEPRPKRAKKHSRGLPSSFEEFMRTMTQGTPIDCGNGIVIWLHSEPGGHLEK